MRQLEVPGHVYVCVDGEHVVFLDLHNDRYWALEAASTRALATIVRGWPAQPADDRRHVGSGQTDPTARLEPNAASLLIDKGLLCDPRATSKPATPIRAASPRLELMNEAASTERRTTGAARFLLAAAIAAAAFRFQSFERLIARTRRRKQLRAAPTARFDIAKAAQVVADFEALRPLLFSARDACLFSSFVLIETLARHGLFPLWVFGVQARPFAAHCWVQHEDIVFNDTVEHVRRYTPIMAI